MEKKKTADQTPNNDKKQALDTAIRQIEKNFGKGAVTGINQVIDVKPLLSILQTSVEGLVSYHCILVDWHSLLVLTVL